MDQIDFKTITDEELLKINKTLEDFIEYLDKQSQTTITEGEKDE